MSLAPVKTSIVGRETRSAFSINDWNGDGLLDILKLEGCITLYKNEGTETMHSFAKTGDTIDLIDCPSSKLWLSPSLDSDYMSAGDFNGDGLKDLVLKANAQGTTVDEWGKNNVTSTVDIYINTGTKTVPEFSYAGRLLDSTDGHYGSYVTMATGDLNDDGAVDIVIAAMTLIPNIGWNIYSKKWELFVWWGIPGETHVVKNQISKIGNIEKIEYDKIQGIIKNSSLETDTKVSLYSLNGSRIIMKSGGKGIWKLSNKLSKGVYLIRINNIKGWSQKILIK